MLADLTESIHAHGCAWKQSSLEYVACGCVGPQRPLQIFCAYPISWICPQYLSYDIPQVTRIVVSGTLLDTEFSEHEGITYRIAAARKNFWMDRAFYASPLVPMTRKFN
eukprot:8315583-Pyramimonas_sp.AAC.1